MDHIVDLEWIMNTWEQDEKETYILDRLYDHACELKITVLIDAIELYWINNHTYSELVIWS